MPSKVQSLQTVLHQCYQPRFTRRFVKLASYPVYSHARDSHVSAVRAVTECDRLIPLGMRLRSVLYRIRAFLMLTRRSTMSVRFRYSTCLQCGLKFLTSIQLTVVSVFDCPLALCRRNVNSSYTKITHITSVRLCVDDSITKA